MSVCHTVIPEQMPDGTIQYHASSPGAILRYISYVKFIFPEVSSHVYKHSLS